jgi:poly(3-hydroxybutyrate) depolymerase
MLNGIKRMNVALLCSAVLLVLQASTLGQGRQLTLKPIEKDLEYRDTTSPERIQRLAQKIDGWDRTWKEYVPESYTGKTAVPLLVVLHGGSSHTGDTRTTSNTSTN